MFGWSHASWRQHSVELTATAAVVIDRRGGIAEGGAIPRGAGGVRVPAALISVAGAPHSERERDPARGAIAVIGATQLAIDVDHPRGALAVSAPASVVATVFPELDLHGIVAEPLTDVVATIDLTQATPATTQVEVTAAAGATRLRASLHGEPATWNGQGVIAMTAIDLGRVTRGRLDGRNDALAALDFGADQVRGTVVLRDRIPAMAAHDAIGALGRTREVLTSPVLGRRGEAFQATRDIEVALGLGAGTDAAPWLVATGTLRRDGATIALEDAHAVARARAVVAGGQRVAGKLAVIAKAGGPLSPALEVKASGVAQGERISVEGLAGTPCGARAAACDRPMVQLATARVPFSLTVSSGTRPGAPPVLDVTGEVAAEVVVVQDVAIAVVKGSFAERVAEGVSLGNAHLTGSGIRRDGSSLGAAHVDIQNHRDGTLFVAATAWPPGPGIMVASEAAITPGTRTVARLGRTRVTLPGGVTWAGRGGSIVVGDAVSVRDVMLHEQRTGQTASPSTGQTAEPGAGQTIRPSAGQTTGPGAGQASGGDATVALRLDLARKTGTLVAHVEAERFAASAIDPRARGLGRGTLDLERRAGRWQADGRFDVTGFAIAPAATPDDPTVHGFAAFVDPMGDPSRPAGNAVAVPTRHDVAALVDGTAHVKLAGQRATLDAHVAGRALGGVDLAFEAVAPRDPFDLGAWRRLDRGAVRNATITARQLELAGLAAVAGAEGPPERGGVTGTIDGAVNLAPAELRGKFAIRGVELPFGAIDGDVTFAPRDGDLGVNAMARLSGVVAAEPTARPSGVSTIGPASRPSGVATTELTARLALPEHPFDPASWPASRPASSPTTGPATRAATPPSIWRDRGRDLLKEATAQLDHVAFDPDLLARLGVTRLLAEHGVTAPYRGNVTARLALGSAGTEARAAIELSGVTGGALVAPVSQHVAITAGPSGTHLRAEAHGGGAGHDVGLGVLEVDLPMTIDRWIEEPAAVLQSPFTARWTLPVTQVVPVLAIVGRRDLSGGTLEGNAAIRGTLATPIVESARLVARDLVVAPRLGSQKPPALADLELGATWGGASGTVTLDGHEATGGRLHGFANGRPDALAAATGSLVTRALDVAPIAALLPGRLASAAGVVDADLALGAGRVTGKLHVTGGALPIAAAVGTLRDTTADLVIGERTIRGTIDGKLGRGTIHLTADTAADLTTTAAKLELRDVSALGSLRPIISADIDARLRLDGMQLRGDVAVAHAHVTLPEHPARPLLDPSAPADLVFVGAPEAAAPAGPRAPVHPWLDVDVKLGPTRFDAHDAVAAPGIDMDVLSVRATLHSDGLHVSAGESVGVRGIVEIDDADADILGRRYLLEPSHVKFDGTIDPLLDIAMSHPFSELTLNVALLGRASQPELRFSSDAGSYSHDQLFGFFVGGEPGGDPTSQTGEAVTGAVIKGLSSGLGRRISKVLPFKLDAVSCAPATTSTSKSCTFGKRLSQRLVIYYSPHLEPLPSENANDLQGEYRLGSKAVIDVTGGDRGHYGADLLWRHRW
jgi:hypothetical protein